MMTVRRSRGAYCFENNQTRFGCTDFLRDVSVSEPAGVLRYGPRLDSY